MRISRSKFVVLMSACGVLCLSTALASGLQDEVAAAKKQAEIPAGAKATTIGESKETACWSTESALYVKLNPPRKSGEIRLPRLANIVSKVHWLGNEDAPLNLHPEPTHWVVKFDKAPEKVTTFVVELDSAPALFDTKHVVAPADDHSITLPARFATTHGGTLRYEPQPHKNTVGYWSNEKDTASWMFRCDKAGVYEVDVLQGCGKGHGGSEVTLRVGDQTLRWSVQETGHFQNFIWLTPGEVTLREGSSLTIELIPVNKTAGAVMDVRAIRLVPKGTEREKLPELAAPESLPKPQ